MTEPSNSRHLRLRFGPLIRVLLPSLATLILVVLLLFTMFFTEFDWQWVTFLGGILFASVLSMVSATWKSNWRSARRAAEAIHYKQRLNAEIEQHRHTREQLERALTLHQQERGRLAKETDGRQLAASGKQAAESLLGALSRYLEEIAVFVDHEQRCRFHTWRFATWTGVPSGRMDGLAFADALPSTSAEALRAPLLDALHGRAGRVELPLPRRDGTAQPMVVNFLPHRDASGAISGTLVLITDQPLASTAASATGSDEAAVDRAEHIDSHLLVADASGNTLYLQSLTEELSGWGNPRERIRHAINNDGFDLYAQAIIALGKDTSAKPMQELLIRMHDEEQNSVPPGTFLPTAERFGMMPDIDRYVVRKAIAAHLAAGHASDAAPAQVLCINLARASILDQSFPEFVARALQQSGVSGAMLCFEIADGDALNSLAEASRFAHALKPLGCRFSLDGFGRAGIGFDHVKSLPLDFLKIDGSIILQILRVPEALAKVRAIQRVCKVIGIRTIAEMVESDESIEKLRAVEVDYAQGFGIAPPRHFQGATVAGPFSTKAAVG